MSATRILFAGTPAIAVPALRALNQMELLGKGIVLAGVLTNPDRRRRHGEEEPSEVSAAASFLDAERKEKGFPPIVQLKPEKLDAFARENVGALGASLLVSFAFGRIFGPRFLALFPEGGINVHPSLLPRFRGASPIPAAILSGDRETGVSIQKLAAEMDSGDILAQERFPLSGRETTVSLSSDAASRAARLLCALLPDFDSAVAAARPQEGEVTYCREIQKEEGRIDWTKSAARLDAEIRAYTPWPLSFTFRGGDKLFILDAAPVDAAEISLPAETARPAAESAAPGTVLGTDAKRGILIQTGNGLLAVSRLQWQAKKALDWKAFLNGARDFLGAKLGGEGAARDAQ